MLTARDRVADRISGLDVGADDYLVKPFAFGELLARPRAQGWGTAGHSGCGARPGSRPRWAVCRRPARLPNASAPLGQTPLGSLADVEGVTNSGLRLLLHCGVRWQTHRVTRLRGHAFSSGEPMKEAALQPTTAAPTIASMRRLLYVNSALVLVIGIPLYVLSDQTDTSFAWTIHPPLTAAVLGADHWASFILELLSARERLWARTRVAVPAVLVFSTLTLVITLVHAGRFHFHSPQLITRAGTWGGCSCT